MSGPAVKPPRFVRPGPWKGLSSPVWTRADKKNVTLLYSFVERRKSFFLRAYLERYGYRYEDLGDHVKEDVTWGREWGNRMECNPMYFTSGALIRNLERIRRETGLTKEQIVERYAFLGGGGQCGPCRYGMYPQEYMKVVNNAGYEDFRILIFSSDIGAAPPRGSAFPMDLPFRINMLIAVLLADILHAAECALRPVARDPAQVDRALEEAEGILYEAFRGRLYLLRIPRALGKVGEIFRSVERRDLRLPVIYVTGEFFANLAHNDGNYHLRRFIMDEGARVIPGLFVNRILYDNWRRTREAEKGIRYAEGAAERKRWKKTLRKQQTSTAIIMYFYRQYMSHLRPERFGASLDIFDLDALAEIGREFYHPEIFGGEGNLEVAEAIHFADEVDGFISCKPFGCMPSSGVSDGVQAKISSLYPQLDFLSIETSGDNEVSILGRVAMLVFRARQKALARD